jgi:hypothetical protein
MHAQQQAKKYFKFFNASDQTDFRPNPCRTTTTHQADLRCTQMQILLSACQISKIQNFHNFLKSHRPKGCFLSDRQKSFEFYLLKNVKKKSLRGSGGFATFKGISLRLLGGSPRADRARCQLANPTTQRCQGVAEAVRWGGSLRPGGSPGSPWTVSPSGT